MHRSTSNDNCDPAEYCSGTDAVVPADKQDCSKVKVDVKGQSGKFSLYDETVGSSDPNKVTIELDYLYEMAANGVDKVGNTGSTKHSIQTFASQDFTIAQPVDTVLNADGDSRNGVGAQRISFASTVSTIGKITVDTYVLKSAGTVGTDSESWAVRANDVKFNIVLSEWTFCAPCGNGAKAATSEFIDVAVKIKGKGAKPEKNVKASKNITYDLGGDVPLVLSNRIEVDGAWTAMPAGYPKMETQGSSAIFIFRFPKFATKASYDPIIGLSSNIEPATDGTTGGSTTGTTGSTGGSTTTTGTTTGTATATTGTTTTSGTTSLQGASAAVFAIVATTMAKLL